MIPKVEETPVPSELSTDDALWGQVAFVFHRLWALVTARQILRVMGPFAILGSGLLLGWTVWHNRELLLSYPWRIRVWVVPLSLAVYSLDLGLAVYSWGRIINRLSGRQLTFRRHFKIYAATNFSRRLPGAVWYIAGRAALYEQDGIAKGVISLASFIEVILIALSSILCYFLAWPLGGSGWGGWPLLLMGLVAGLALIHPRVMGSLWRRLGQPEATKLHYRDMLTWLLLYVLVWAVGGVTLYSVMAGLHPLSWSALPHIVRAWSLSGAAAVIAFFSPSGLGIKEVTLTLLLGPVIPVPLSAIVALLMRLLLTIYELLWAAAALKL